MAPAAGEPSENQKNSIGDPSEKNHLRGAPSENLIHIHRGGVDIKWNGPLNTEIVNPSRLLRLL